MPTEKGKTNKKITLRYVIYLVVIFILMVVLCLYNPYFIAPSIILFIALIIYSITSNSKRQNEIVEHIREITTDVNTATKKNLINSPIPLIIAETDGNIIWKSSKFVEVFQDVNINAVITPILKEIKMDIEKNGENKDISKQITINKNVYIIRGGVARSKKKDKRNEREYILTLYFLDDTKYNKLFDDFSNSKTCIAIANIDNYDEIIKTALPGERLDLITQVEKELFDWAKNSGGLIIKTDTDTFIFIFEQQYLTQFEKEKFDIINRIKELDTDAQVTLSMAVSNEGNSLYEKYKSALKALDIVLGRGGDQVIVRKDGKYKFYGGTTVEVEKRTKIKARTIANSLADLIEDSDVVITMGHSNIDIDAIGSCFGICKYAKALDKKAYIVSKPAGNSLEKFLDEIKKVEDYNDIFVTPEELSDIITDKTLLVVLDTHKPSYVEFPELLDKIKRKVIIDHHRKATEYIKDSLLSFHEVYASSAAELVTEILQYSRVPIDLSLIEAEGLYGGIMVDTKNFTFKTGVRTFEAAAYLRKFGVDIIRVKKWFQADLESYNLISAIVRTAEIINDNIAIAVYGNVEDENANLICAKTADELLTISDIDASFVLGQVGDKVFISGRSVGNVNVQIILEKLGGGGHITLAGAQLEGMSLEDAKNELIIRINEYFTETI